ncbi:hypothetical protein BKA69DRAFT_879393 [Paraphysoderma sedebokerense]|nr:hypothetical protein BKA69DRAFT_879393 [Paraphysoderma sedebokerense]
MLTVTMKMDLRKKASVILNDPNLSDSESEEDEDYNPSGEDDSLDESSSDESDLDVDNEDGTGTDQAGRLSNSPRLGEQSGSPRFGKSKEDRKKSSAGIKESRKSSFRKVIKEEIPHDVLKSQFSDRFDHLKQLKDKIVRKKDSIPAELYAMCEAYLRDISHIQQLYNDTGPKILDMQRNVELLRTNLSDAKSTLNTQKLEETDQLETVYDSVTEKLVSVLTASLDSSVMQEIEDEYEQRLQHAKSQSGFDTLSPHKKPRRNLRKRAEVMKVVEERLTKSNVKEALNLVFNPGQLRKVLNRGRKSKASTTAVKVEPTEPKEESQESKSDNTLHLAIPNHAPHSNNHKSPSLSPRLSKLRPPVPHEYFSSSSQIRSRPPHNSTPTSGNSRKRKVKEVEEEAVFIDTSPKVGGGRSSPRLNGTGQKSRKRNKGDVVHLNDESEMTVVLE